MHQLGGAMRSHVAAAAAAHPHVVEGNPHAVAEVLAEERDLGVALAEVVQHDEVGVHPHADADGLRGRAVAGAGR